MEDLKFLSSHKIKVETKNKRDLNNLTISQRFGLIAVSLDSYVSICSVLDFYKDESRDDLSEYSKMKISFDNSSILFNDDFQVLCCWNKDSIHIYSIESILRVISTNGDLDQLAYSSCQLSKIQNVEILKDFGIIVQQDNSIKCMNIKCESMKDVKGLEGLKKVSCIHVDQHKLYVILQDGQYSEFSFKQSLFILDKKVNLGIEASGYDQFVKINNVLLVSFYQDGSKELKLASYNLQDDTINELDDAFFSHFDLQENMSCKFQVLPLNNQKSLIVSGYQGSNDVSALLNKDNTVEVLDLEESSRIELPVSADSDDVSCVGIGFIYPTLDLIKSVGQSDNEVSVPIQSCPLIFVMTESNLLLVYKCVIDHGELHGLQKQFFGINDCIQYRNLQVLSSPNKIQGDSTFEALDKNILKSEVKQSNKVEQVPIKPNDSVNVVKKKEVKQTVLENEAVIKEPQSKYQDYTITGPVEFIESFNFTAEVIEKQLSMLKQTWKDVSIQLKDIDFKGDTSTCLNIKQESLKLIKDIKGALQVYSDSDQQLDLLRDELAISQQRIQEMKSLMLKSPGKKINKLTPEQEEQLNSLDSLVKETQRRINDLKDVLLILNGSNENQKENIISNDSITSNNRSNQLTQMLNTVKNIGQIAYVKTGEIQKVEENLDQVLKELKISEEKLINVNSELHLKQASNQSSLKLKFKKQMKKLSDLVTNGQESNILRLKQDSPIKNYAEVTLKLEQLKKLKALNQKKSFIDKSAVNEMKKEQVITQDSTKETQQAEKQDVPKSKPVNLFAQQSFAMPDSPSPFVPPKKTESNFGFGFSIDKKNEATPSFDFRPNASTNQPAFEFKPNQQLVNQVKPLFPQSVEADSTIDQKKQSSESPLKFDKIQSKVEQKQAPKIENKDVEDDGEFSDQKDEKPNVFSDQNDRSSQDSDIQQKSHDFDRNSHDLDVKDNKEEKKIEMEDKKVVADVNSNKNLPEVPSKNDKPEDPFQLGDLDDVVESEEKQLIQEDLNISSQSLESVEMIDDLSKDQNQQVSGQPQQGSTIFGFGNTGLNTPQKQQATSFSFGVSNNNQGSFTAFGASSVGQQVPTAFNTPATPQFGASTQFGQSTSATPKFGASGFGQSGFGTPAAFGQTSFGTPSFGQTGFGQPAQTSQTPPSNSSGFAAFAGSQATPSFGAVAQQSSIFGQQAAANTSFGFGSPSQSQSNQGGGSLFGSVASKSTNVFGGQQTQSSSNLPQSWGSHRG